MEWNSDIIIIMEPQAQVVRGRRDHQQEQEARSLTGRSSSNDGSNSGARSYINVGDEDSVDSERKELEEYRYFPPPPPDTPTFAKKIRKCFLFYVMVPIVAPPLLAFGVLRRKVLWADLIDLYRLVEAAHDSPVDTLPEYHDPKIVARVLKLPSARAYIQHEAFEWQKQEGFCAPASLRCVLKSFGFGNSGNNWRLPCQGRGGPSTPEKWCAAIHKCSGHCNGINCKLVRLQ